MVPVWLPLYQLIQGNNLFAPAFIIMAVCVIIYFIKGYDLHLFSSYLTFFTHLSCICLLRSPRMDSSVVFVSNKPRQMDVQYQSSPFQLELKEVSGHKQNLSDGLSFTVTSQKPHWFAFFWGCEINAFHQAVAMDWMDLRRQLRDGLLFESTPPLESSEAELSFEMEREVLIKSRKGLVEENFGPSPRARFPLILVMVLHQEEDEPDPKSTDAVALICAVHVRDSVCTSESTFVFKLSKLANGQVLNVTKLFSRDHSVGEDAAICLVCEAQRVTIGLLPCRHFSLCETCFERLPSPKQCPVCRSYVTRFFQHRPDANSRRPAATQSSENLEDSNSNPTQQSVQNSSGILARIKSLFV